MTYRTRTWVALVALVGLQAVAAAQRPPSLNDVVDRLMTYIAGYGPRLESVVAEEAYAQWTEMIDARTDRSGGVAGPRRVIRSDYALVRLGNGEHWVAFRDAFEVDGAPVRDREDRMSALLAAGGDNALRQAEALANESARFNLATNLVSRNVNVPTLVVTLLHPKNRERFSFSRSRETQPGDARWEVEFRERERPTLVRQQDGRDQPVRGAIAVDPRTGEIWETRLTWERGPGGHITVTFGRVDGIDTIVPVKMVEHYRAGPTIIFGEATYSNFRQFRTAARVVTP